MDDHDLSPCHLLPWDSEFFGFRIARAKDALLTARSLQDILEWSVREQIRCLYLLASSNSLRNDGSSRSKRLQNG